MCNYCSDSTFYGIVARAFDLREKDHKQDLPLYQRTREPVQETTLVYQPCTHNDGIMNEYGGLFLSPPPLTPQPSQYCNPALFEVDPLPHNLLPIDLYDLNFEIPNNEIRPRDRETPDPKEERIRRAFEELEREDPYLPAERVNTDTVHRPSFEESNVGNVSEGTVAPTEEQGQLPVRRGRSRSRFTPTEASSRAYNPQSREGCQSQSTPGYNEESSTLIAPPVAQATNITLEGQSSDCYRCNRPNSWENMIACDSDHGSRERWFHMSCAGLTMATMPTGDGKRHFSNEDLQNTNRLRLEKWWCDNCSRAGLHDESNSSSYQDNTEESSDSDGQVDPGENCKGKQKQCYKITESRSRTNDDDNVDADDPAGSFGIRKRKRDRDGDDDSDEDDDGGTSAYSGNSRKRRRQHESMVKQSSGHSKRPGHLQNTPNTTSALAAQPRQKSERPDNYPKDTAEKVRDLMKEVLEEGHYIEKKWSMISDRLLERHGIQKGAGSIKMFWSRRGRAEFKLDERKLPNPQKWVTSKQSPEDRKKARQKSG